MSISLKISNSIITLCIISIFALKIVISILSNYKSKIIDSESICFTNVLIFVLFYYIFVFLLIFSTKYFNYIQLNRPYVLNGSYNLSKTEILNHLNNKQTFKNNNNQCELLTHDEKIKFSKINTYTKNKQKNYFKL